MDAYVLQLLVLPDLDVRSRYIMSLLGINVTANNATSVTHSSADPSVTLGAAQFEDAVSQIAAQYVWIGEFA